MAVIIIIIQHYLNKIPMLWAEINPTLRALKLIPFWFFVGEVVGRVLNKGKEHAK